MDTRIEKKLVGEWFETEVELNPEYDYKAELYTNINRNVETYPLELSGGRFKCRLELRQSGFFYWKIRYQRVGTKTWRWLKDHNGKHFAGLIQVDPAYLDSAIAYNVFVRFFRGSVNQTDCPAKPGEGGTFDDVKAHLDTLKEMGITILYLNPIHLIGELYRKYNALDQLPAYWQPGSPYSVKDYKSIDPELTYDRDTKKHLLSDPQQEFKDLIEAAHQRGMCVIMDLVFNHTSHDFVFQRLRPEWYLYKEDPTSLEAPYLSPSDLKLGKPWGDARHTVSPYDHGLWFEDAAQLNWEYMIPTGSNAPPKNPALSEMWEYFKSIPRYWVKHFGIDGFRCDVAYRVPSAFWKACIADTRKEAESSRLSLSKDVIFIAESYTDNLGELQEAGFTAVYGDFSNKLKETDDFFGYLDYMLNINQNFFPSGSKWFVFPESHDFSRTPEKILGDQAGNAELGKLANKSRWLLTSTIPGIPLVFSGLEKVEVKPINLFGYGAIDWSKQADLTEFIIKVNQLRKTQPALSLTAAFKPIFNTNQVAAYLRQKGKQTLLVVVNFNVFKESGFIQINLPEEYGQHLRLTDLIHNKQFMVNDGVLELGLEPGEGYIFQLEKFT